MHSIRSMAEQLALGVPPTQILTQQINHLSYAASGPGGLSAAFGGVVSSLKGIVTPTTAAVAGVAALGAGFAVLLTRAQSNAEQLRQYNLVLQQTGRLSSSLDIGAENAQLRSLGISRDAADTQRLAIARNPSLNANSGGLIQALGANIGAFLGTGPEAGFAQLTQAISAGPEATIRFAASLGTLSAQQAAALISWPN